MRCNTSLTYPCSPLPANATKPSLNEIGHTVAESRTFRDIASKPHPLMNINEMGTKNNRDHLPIMGNPPPWYENGQTLRCWLRVVTSNQQWNVDLAPPLMNINEMQYVINLHMFSTTCQCHQTKFERNWTYGCRVTHILRNRFQAPPTHEY